MRTSQSILGERRFTKTVEALEGKAPKEEPGQNTAISSSPASNVPKPEPQQKATPTITPSCPRCSSKKIWQDAKRYTSEGFEIQRWSCRDCGYRFSDPNDVQKAKAAAKLVERIDTKSLKSKDALVTNRQICVKETKNLAAEPKMIEVLRRNEAENKGVIVGFSFWLLKQGYSQATIKGRIKLLQRLMRLGADFKDEDSIKEIIATQQWSISRKVNAVDAYDSLLKTQGRTWTPPIYKRVRKLPFIPTETEIDQLIAGCSPRIATYLQLLKETGMRCGEASLLKWTDLDIVNQTVRITPEKGSNPRILPISNKLVDMLNELPKNTVTVFGVSSDLMRRNYCKQRKQLVFKLKNSRLQQITFHTFRHWKATMEYYKTRDILHVKEILGHKSLVNTMLYTQLIGFKDDDFIARVAHNEDEACKFVESGFKYVCDFNGNKIFRKRK